MEMNQTSHGGKRCNSARGKAVLLAAVLGLLPLAAGCSAPAKPPQQATKMEGGLNQPTVISSRPAQDTAALHAADDQLKEADWLILQKLGPRPIWERIA